MSSTESRSRPCVSLLSLPTELLVPILSSLFSLTVWSTATTSQDDAKEAHERCNIRLVCRLLNTIIVSSVTAIHIPEPTRSTLTAPDFLSGEVRPRNLQKLRLPLSRAVSAAEVALWPCRIRSLDVTGGEATLDPAALTTLLRRLVGLRELKIDFEAIDQGCEDAFEACGLEILTLERWKRRRRGVGVSFVAQQRAKPMAQEEWEYFHARIPARLPMTLCRLMIEGDGGPVAEFEPGTRLPAFLTAIHLTLAVDPPFILALPSCVHEISLSENALGVAIMDALAERLHAGMEVFRFRLGCLWDARIGIGSQLLGKVVRSLPISCVHLDIGGGCTDVRHHERDGRLPLEISLLSLPTKLETLVLGAEVFLCLDMPNPQFPSTLKSIDLLSYLSRGAPEPTSRILALLPRTLEHLGVPDLWLSPSLEDLATSLSSLRSLNVPSTSLRSAEVRTFVSSLQSLETLYIRGARYAPGRWVGGRRDGRDVDEPGIRDCMSTSDKVLAALPPSLRTLHIGGLHSCSTHAIENARATGVNVLCARESELYRHWFHRLRQGRYNHLPSLVAPSRE
ncbi:hypothetical protein BDK51DRAFT_25579 [Blyttiomyces helicus]|uniref:F-box domain-containing protein n=1 Tax=Blyttiomyces helicus TaxID=388810 RepID=A0A4P9WQJ0_9FUNG|nr:hypothetical protein BDK51DRAFT_25579 [Blyttiomyces helicus]|eukprot:RKO93480.1 hypothetical protein BDK51DRAFT_25579 [Blyttiomyces helicus]